MKFVISHPLMDEGMELLKQLDAEVFVANSNYPEEYLGEIQKADAVILREGVFRKNLIEQCPNLKVIGITGVGYDNVDVDFAAEKGIPVVITPGANQRSVAEQVIAFMLLFGKNLVRLDEETRKGNWNYRNEGKGFEMYGKTIGIVGCGRIGRTVAEICKVMGMRCLGYDIVGRAAVEACGCEYRENLDDLLKESDFVTIHCLLNESTTNLINKEKLALMKPTAYLINCARGPIVNEKDLAEALNNDVIAGAALDVYSVEPASIANPVFKAKNVFCTPHTSGIAKEALARMCTMCVEGCTAVMNGELYPAVANCKVYEHPKFARVK